MPLDLNKYMHNDRRATIWLLLFAATLLFGTLPAYATTCANVVTSDSGGDGSVDTSFPLGFAIGEFIILMFVIGLIAVRRTQTHGPLITKGNIFGGMIIVQAALFLVFTVVAYSMRQGVLLPPSTKNIVIASLLQSVGYALFCAVLMIVVGLVILGKSSLRLKGRTLIFGSLLAMLVLVPMYALFISTPRC